MAEKMYKFISLNKKSKAAAALTIVPLLLFLLILNKDLVIISLH